MKERKFNHRGSTHTLYIKDNGEMYIDLEGHTTYEGYTENEVIEIYKEKINNILNI